MLGLGDVSRLDGLFGNLDGFLVLLRTGALRLDGVLVDVGVLVVGVVIRVVVGVRVVVVVVVRSRVGLDGDFLLVVGRLEALTVLAFDFINRVYQVLVVTGVDLNASVVVVDASVVELLLSGVLRGSRSRSGRGRAG